MVRIDLGFTHFVSFSSRFYVFLKTFDENEHEGGPTEKTERDTDLVIITNIDRNKFSNKF